MNRQVRGRVVDEAGAPLRDLTVYAADLDWRADTALRDGASFPLAVSDPLGEVPTDADGRFAISYSPGAYLDLGDLRPDILVTVCDPLGVRPVATSGPHVDVRARVLDVGDILVPRGRAFGWAATGASAAPFDVTHGNRVELLVDNEAGFGRLQAAIEGASREILLTQLLFDEDFRAAFPAEDAEDAPTLLEALGDAAARGVAVRILLNENVVVPDSVDEVRARLEGAHEKRPRVRRYPMTPGVLHSKTLVVDDEEGFLIGSPFQQKYWDTSEHRVDEPRRSGRQPHHDHVLVVRGPAVARLRAHIAALWDQRAQETLRLEDLLPPGHPAEARPPAGDQTVQIVETLPETTGEAWRRTGILESYLRAIAHARRFVYIENQYFTSARVAEALRRALARRPLLEVVMLLNEHMDLPSYDTWQARRLRAMGHPHHPRLGVFTRWTAAERAGRIRARACYVHSKLAVVDDSWATVGTANLDSVSLEGAREARLDRQRSVEVNAVLLDGVDGAPATGEARRLREAMWREHLRGLPAWARTIPPDGPPGIVAGWRAHAGEQLRRLQDGTLPPGAVVLPLQPPLPRQARMGSR